MMNNINNNNDEYDHFLSVKTILYTTRCDDRVRKIFQYTFFPIFTVRLR
jgi:hypothetical protein